jgi:hypothetical protein
MVVGFLKQSLKKVRKATSLFQPACRLPLLE